MSKNVNKNPVAENAIKELGLKYLHMYPDGGPLTPYTLALHETVSSYTLTSLVDNELHETLQNAILILCADVRSLGDGGNIIRVGPASGLISLVNDRVFKSHRINLEIGMSKNVNKNPVAENAIKELGLEYLHMYPDGGPLTPLTLALATATMNARIRKGGLSGREIWTQRDQVTGEQLPINDRQIILQPQFSREQNHAASTKSKSHGKLNGRTPDIQTGDLVYLIMDRDKTRARDKYLAVGVSGDRC